MPINQVRFVLPSLPNSVNSIYQIIYSQRRIELKGECRTWKTKAKQIVPQFTISEGSTVCLDTVFHFPFCYKNGKPRIFDPSNLLKLLQDAVAERCGFNDFLVRSGSWKSIDDSSEYVVVTLTEIASCT